MTETAGSKSGLKIIGLAALFVSLALAGFAILSAEPEVPSQARPQLAPNASDHELGAAAFLGAGFGGISQAALETNAIPWKLAAAALVLEEQSRDPSAKADLTTLQAILARFGFLFPTRLEGVPKGISVDWQGKPLGMTHGTIAPIGGTMVEVANLGCAACHAGVAYDRAGSPDPTLAMVGMPNTSLDLESYTQAIYVAMRNHANSDALIPTAQSLFPEMGWRERQSLRWIVLPLARQRLEEMADVDQPLPFSNGLPGATNGVAALKLQLQTPLLGDGLNDRGFVSIPELALRDRRNRLLADGAYAVPSGKTDAESLAAITSFFTVPSMGVHPDEARSHSREANAIFKWLANYRPAKFPGPMDLPEARKGWTIFEDNCASCHGSFEWTGDRPNLVSFPNWIGDVGTDPLRSEAFDDQLAQAVRTTSYALLIDVKIGEGYAAPPLAGLWASAPYLHNGSVQSLAALLDPSRRLPRFMVGGHALDWASVGLRVDGEGRYLPGHVAFSTPQWVDTSMPGLSNSGHEFGSELSASDRAALIEFLKLL